MTIRKLSAILALSYATACLAADRVPPPRTLYETSFEEGDGLPQGWSVDYGQPENFQLARGTAHTGTRSVRIADASETKAAGLRSAKIKATPGERIWLEAWYFAPQGGRASMYFEYWNEDGKRLDKEIKSFAVESGGEWQRTRSQHIVPDSATHLTILLYCSTKSVCDGYFDDVKLGTGFQPTHDRTPRPPASVTHPCGPYSPEDIERAKRNIEKHEWAQAKLRYFKGSSKFWIDMPDEEIAKWIPELTPFRVCDCPTCGAGWSVCWKPLADGRFKCLKCGTEYPNERFTETKTEVLLSPTGKLIPHSYYENEEGTKFRLSGYSRWVRIHNLSRLGDMGRSYALTGDVAYAKKAVKVMRRLAEVYPDWVPHDWYKIYEDYSNTQSGKMCGWKLHDCTVMLEVCLCYDLICNSGVLTEEDKTAIENNVFRELGEMLLPIPQRGCCINDGPFQMSAAAYLGVILGDHRLVKWAVEPPGGFRGFIRDYFFRDGHWEDGSPSYEAMALNKLYLLPEILQGYSDPPDYKGNDRYDRLDVLSDPLIRKIHIAPLYNMFPDRTLPPINDGCMGGGYSQQHAEVNAFWYPTQRNREILNWVYRGNIGESGSEYSLWRRDPDVDFAKVGQMCLSEESILRPGLGWAILREGKGDDRTDLVLDYGEPCGWHGHPDRLNFLLWAKGREVATDLGYLGARHPLRPWMAHGVCHNLVMVDGKDQAREPGKLILFQPGRCVQAVVAEAPKTYAQCSKYERAMLLITPEPGIQYVVDVFRVEGGGQHDFCFHGDGAVFECAALKDAKACEDEVGPKEGGYDWLEEVKTAPAQGEVVADWRFGKQEPKAADVGVRLRMLDAAGELLNGKGPNLRNRRTPYLKAMLDHVIQRRRGPRNTFVSVVEPVKGKPAVISAGRIPIEEEGAKAEGGFNTVAVKVTHAEGTEYVVVAPDASRRVLLRQDDGKPIEVVGRLGVLSVDNAGQTRFLWLADGTSIRCADRRVETVGTFTGKIADFDEMKSTFRVDSELPEGPSLSGQPIIAQNRVDGAYTVDRVGRIEGGSLVHLKNEPMMKVEKGEAFRLPTYAMLSRSGRVSDSEVAPWRATAVVPTRIATSGNGKKTFARVGGQAWQELNTAQGVAQVDPNALGGRDIRLLFAGRTIDCSDVEPPKLLSIGPSATAQDDGSYVLGFLRGPEVRCAFADRSGLGSVEASVQGATTGRGRVDVTVRGIEGGKTAATIALADLPEDEFTLRVNFADRLGNDDAVVIQFQTKGILQNFTDMKIVEDSGQDSKPLPSLETQFYRGKTPGDFVEYEFEVAEGGKRRIGLVHTQAPSYGMWQFSIDGEKIGGPVDGYAEEVVACGGKVQLGGMKLSAGKHRIRVDVVGKNEKATNYLVGLGKLVLKPE